MTRDFWLLAHPDDEIFGIPLLAQKNTVKSLNYIISSPEKRKLEAYCFTRIMRTAGHDISCNFSTMKFTDGLISSEINDEFLVELYEQIKSFKPDRIIVLAAEGGHQDHECVNFLGSLIAKALKLELIQLAAYSKSKKWPGYQVMHIDPVYEVYAPKSLNYALMSLRVAINYKSQWKTWIGLLPFIFVFYLTREPRIKKGYSKLEDFLKPKPLYEARGRANSEREHNNLYQINKLFERGFGVSL